MQLRWSLFPEIQTTALLEQEIRELLVLAFPQYSDFFSQNSYRGSAPTHRLVGRLPSNQLVAHLAGGPRQICVNDQAVQIFGIGAVAVHPECQGTGVGREMFTQLRASLRDANIADFGFLECGEHVESFYRRAGFVRLSQPSTSMHHETREWQTYRGPVMALPVRRPIEEWPQGGEIHLQGYDW
jgi:nodulation protein A